MSRQILPNERKLLLGDTPDESCAHLQPVLHYLRARGLRIESCYRLPSGWLITVLDGFFYKRDVYAAFEVPEFVTWEYAEPHFGEGNRLSCQVCRNSLESRFDITDAQATLGE